MRARIGIMIVSAALVLAALPAAADPGDVVTGYGSGGWMEIPDSGGPHWIGALAARPSGAALLTGSSIGAGSGEQSFWVTEVATDGSSFTDATDIGLGRPYAFGSAIALRPDASFAVAGELSDTLGGQTELFVARFNPDLTLDPSFVPNDLLVPDGVVLVTEAGVWEHATSVFFDTDHVVVGGFAVDGVDQMVRVAKLNPDGSPDPAFGPGGSTFLAWGGVPDASFIESAVWPGAGGDYLAVGVGFDKAGWIASMMIDGTTGAASPAQLLASAAATHWDSAPLRDGGVVVAFVLFSPIDGALLDVMKINADGTMAWRASGLEALSSTSGVTVTELRDGTIAVVSNVTELGSTYRVTHYTENGTLAGTVLTDLEVDTLLGPTNAWAAGSVATDGGLLVSGVLAPPEDDSIEGALAVAKYLGDDSGRFIDDDGSVHEGNIESLALLEVTGGCDATNLALYCPAAPVTRAQMATFLVRAAGIPPAPGNDPFADDDGSVHEANIGAIQAAGITQGCDAADPTRYCPDDGVSRGQMATFLVRAFGLAGVVPTDPDPFADDDGSVHEPNIAIIADLGITSGCDVADPSRFCPNDIVTRAQMASFLVRSLAVVP